MGIHIEDEGVGLRGYLALPAEQTSKCAVVLCHGLPIDMRERSGEGLRNVELADRIAQQVGMIVLTLNMRGTGKSEGSFSLGGWIDDIKSGIQHLERDYHCNAVLLVGFGLGASIALYVAGSSTGDDNSICGVASFAARAHFDDWYDRSDEMLQNFREMGLISDSRFPEDVDAWREELRVTRPIDFVENIPPRPLLLVHGSADESVPIMEVHDLAAAAHGNADVREIQGAGHRLQYDPRVIALLLGWLDDQQELSGACASGSSDNAEPTP